MEEKLVFSVSGLTVRGFFEYKNEWVPEPSQRLQCHLPGPKKPINVLICGKSVGSVCKEAPDGFKDWLSKGQGKMEAVVADYPKPHRSKGEEVPVIYVLTGEKGNLLMNIKREIENDVYKKQKKKKSLKIEDGDVSSSVIKNMVSDGFEDVNEIDFSIVGMHVRGFHKHMEDWFPEKDQRCCCSISKERSVEVSYKGTTVGNVETNGQKLFRKFIEADGVISAVVTGDPKKNPTKGKEVPVIYVLTAADWTNELKNIRNEIKKDVEKRSKKKKSLKVIPGDATLKNENSDNTKDNQMDSSNNHLHAGTSRDIKKEKAILKEQTPVATDGSGEGTSVQSVKIIYSRKRRSDESGDTVAKKMASSEQVQGEEINGTQPDVEKRSKKKKSLKVIPGDATLKNENSDNTKENSDNQMDSSDNHLHAGTSRDIKKEKAILKEQTPVATDGSGEGTSVQSDKKIHSRKRRSDESGDTVAKKVASSEQVQSEEINGSEVGSVLQIEPNDDKIEFEEKDFSRMSREIGNNWMLLGSELELTSARIDQLRMDYSHQVRTQIFKMLIEWQKTAGGKATLCTFLEAMKHCKGVTFAQPQFNKILLGIRKRYEGGRTSSGTEDVTFTSVG